MRDSEVMEEVASRRGFHFVTVPFHRDPTTQPRRIIVSLQFFVELVSVCESRFRLQRDAAPG
jgi:hypothetical protein